MMAELAARIDAMRSVNPWRAINLLMALVAHLWEENERLRAALAAKEQSKCQ